ncbi:MAG: ATP-binding protein [Bacteroidota bacterium]|nr:ATP-binding protein [Bacteroidota bacterium]
MVKNINQLLEETERLNKENAVLQQQLLEAKESIDAIRTGSIDALVIADKKNLKVLTDATADKIYRILIEKMPEGAVTLNEDGTILFCNSYFANMVNLPLQKVTGTKFKKFIDETSKERIENLFKQKGENAVKEEIYIHANDGKAIPVLMTANTFFLDNIFVLSIILTDLTIQKKNQEELKLKTRQLEQKNIELENTNKELAFQSEEKEKRRAELIIANKELVFQNEEKEKRAVDLMIANKELEAFTYVASHDLQEPLRKIQTFAGLLHDRKKELLSEDVKADLNKISNAADRMRILINDLLNYSHTVKDSSSYVQTDLNEIVANVLMDFDLLITQKKAVINYDPFPIIEAIPLQMNQLFNNLIANALKFSKQDIPPVIDITTSMLSDVQLNQYPNLKKEKEYVKLIVKDNGIGFNQQYAEQVFTIFQRLNARTEFAGTGIGLAMCRKIALNHNGEIYVEAKENEGAIFHIILPVRQ